VLFSESSKETARSSNNSFRFIVTAQLQLLICGFFGSLNGSLVKDQKAPPPLTGEVWGEGDGGEEDSYENLEEIIEHLTVSYMLSLIHISEPTRPY